MEIHFSERMKDFEEGIFQVLNEKKTEVEKQGKKTFNLSIGTPDFQPAEHIMKKKSTTLSQPFTKTIAPSAAHSSVWAG